MGHAEDCDSPKPTILFGLGAALGKEEVMSKVDLGDEQEVDWEQWDTEQAGSKTVLGEGWSWRGQWGSDPQGLALKKMDFLLQQSGAWEGLCGEVASSYLSVRNGL